MTRLDKLADDLGYLLARQWLDGPDPQADADATAALRAAAEEATSAPHHLGGPASLE